MRQRKERKGSLLVRRQKAASRRAKVPTDGKGNCRSRTGASRSGAKELKPENRFFHKPTDPVGSLRWFLRSDSSLTECESTARFISAPWLQVTPRDCERFAGTSLRAGRPDPRSPSFTSPRKEIGAVAPWDGGRKT